MNTNSVRTTYILGRDYLVVLLVAAVTISGWGVGRARAANSSTFDANGQCVGDADGDGQVSINELVGAVDNALSGCQFMPITLNFLGNVGDLPFQCGNVYHNIGTTNADLVPSDFRFYLYNIRLVTPQQTEVPLKLDQDGVWQVDDIVLLDFEDKVPPCSEGTTETNSVVHGQIEPGTYTGIRFKLGLPFVRNHGDQSVAPSPLDLSAMFWSWQDGYKFLLIDTAFDNVRVHLGSIGCYYSTPGVVGGCTRMDVAEIDLDNFNPATNSIVADMAGILSDFDITSNQVNTAPGCQSDVDDDDCIPIFKDLGLNFADGTITPGTQKFFRVQ